MAWEIIAFSGRAVGELLVQRGIEKPLVYAKKLLARLGGNSVLRKTVHLLEKEAKRPVLAEDFMRWLQDSRTHRELAELDQGKPIDKITLLRSFARALALHETDPEKLESLLSRFLAIYRQLLLQGCDGEKTHRLWVDSQHGEILAEITGFRAETTLRLDRMAASLRDAAASGTGVLSSPWEPDYALPCDYLPRQVSPVSDSEGALPGPGDRTRDEVQRLQDIVISEKHLVLVADAGVGKTTELESLAAIFSREGMPLAPFLIRLNTHSYDAIADMLPAEFKAVVEDHQLVLLDGFDEALDKELVARRIEAFAQRYPDAHMVISCRRNFYTSPSNQFSGTLAGFTPWLLLHLDRDQAREYVVGKLGQPKGRQFLDAAARTRVQDLLLLPFYLVSLVRIYSAKQTLPETRADLFEALTEERFIGDVEHTHNQRVDLLEQKEKVFSVLERLAVGMETLCRNYINDEEYRKLISDSSDRELLKHCGVWRKDDTTGNWQFEHNNFQEFWAARALGRQPLQTIKEFVSFGPDHRKVIPSWSNTVAFLLEIRKGTELTDWILDVEPEQALRCELQRIDERKRFRIFRSIFEDYRDKRIWFNPDKFHHDDLARFANSPETAAYLLDELENVQHYTTKGNAISVLRYMNMPDGERTRCGKSLEGVATDPAGDDMTRHRALGALAAHRLHTPERIRRIVAALAAEENAYIRCGLYVFLHVNGLQDEHVDVFLNGIQYLRPRVASGHLRLMNEGHELVEGLVKVKSPPAFRRILEYFTKHPHDVDTAFVSRSFERIVQAAIKLHADGIDQYDDMLNLFGAVVRYDHENKAARAVLTFFEQTEARRRAFETVLAEWRDRTILHHALALLGDRECLERLVAQYVEGAVSADIVEPVRNLLRWVNPELRDWFHEYLNEKTDNAFPLPPPVDSAAQQKARWKRYVELLFDREAFLVDLEALFRAAGAEDLSFSMMRGLRSEDEDAFFHPNLTFDIVADFCRERSVTLDEIKKWATEETWSRERIGRIYSLLSQDVEIELTEEQRKWVKEWCYAKVKSVDFKAAITIEEKTQGRQTISVNRMALYLWFFLREFGLKKYPQEVLLDMISFDFIESDGFRGIAYLEQLILEEDCMTERVLQNLRQGIPDSHVLRNHLNYCIRKRVVVALEFAEALIADSSKDADPRELAVKLVCTFDGWQARLEALLGRLDREIMWDVVDRLVPLGSESCREFLVGALGGEESEDRWRAANALIRLGDVRGVEFCLSRIKSTMRYFHVPGQENPLAGLKNPGALPLLMELLEISYNPNLEQEEHRTLRSDVLDALTVVAFLGEEHYVQVVSVVRDFMEQHPDIEDVHFLNAFLERLERKYYVLKSAKVSLEEVRKKLRHLDAQ